MKLTALAHTPPGADWQALLDSLIQSDPGLDQLETTERTYLFQLWQARGERSQLVAALETHPDWLPLAWQLLADEYANASNFEKAWSVQKRFGISEAHLANQSALKENIQQLERNHLLNPNDLRRGVDLYYALKATKRQTEALRLVEKLIALPDSPPFLRQELAILHAQNRDFRRAYETLKAALARRS
jgi:tetratricopeptide (TPR) repeat protein